MKLYAAMNRLFRRSYALKLFAVAFLGTHIPLLALLGWSIWRGWDSDPLLVQVAVLCLFATLAGTALTLYLLHGLLAPVRASAAALDAFDTHAVLPQLPEDGHDEAGLLMRGLNRSLRRIDDGIRELEWVARHDALTGALNRHGGNVQLAASIAGLAERAAFTVAVLDMDALKQINDQHGHTVGDEVLRALARIVLGNVRATDCAGRYGGDEFAIVLRGMHLDGATAVAHRIREQVQALQLHDMPGLQFTTSMGVATADHRHSSLRAWTNAADAELYQAKAAGRNRVSASSMPDMAPVV